MKRFIVVVALLAAATQAHAQSDAGGLIGGLIGGAIGSQAGSGNGKIAATVVGTLAGQYVGQRITQTTQSYQTTRSYQAAQPDQQSQQYGYTDHGNSNMRPIQSSRASTPRLPPVQRTSTYQDRNYDDRAYDRDYSERAYQERPSYRQPVREPRYQTYTYAARAQDGRRINIVGCAEYDRRNDAWRPVEMQNCENDNYNYYTE